MRTDKGGSMKGPSPGDRGHFYLELSSRLTKPAASVLHSKHGPGHIQAFFESKEISF